MASTLITTGRATTHARTIPSRWKQAQRVMREAWAAVRACGIPIGAALRQAWATEKALRHSEGAKPLQDGLRAALASPPAAAGPGRRELLIGLSAAPVMIRPAHPDAALIALGRALMAAWDREIATFARRPGDAETTAVMDVSSGIVRRIETMPARTVDGLKVKALALSWCQCGDPMDAADLDEHSCTNERLAVSIVNDLVAMGGRL